MEALISIIIPVYNLEKCISKCLDSVLSQTYTNLQVIIINDGSIDNTADVVKGYLAKDKRISLIDKANEGVSIARNVGIEHATGEYLMFVDGDDWIDTDMVEKLYSFIVKYDVDFAGGGFVFEDIESGRKRFSSGNYNPQVITGKKIFEYFLIGKYLWGSVCGAIYKKDIVDKYKLRFTKGLLFGEDVFFNAQFMTKAEKVLSCSEHFYHVLARVSSATRKSVHEKEQYKAIDYEDFLKKENLWEEYKEAYQVWFIRYSNYRLYHLALKVNYKDYKDYFEKYSQGTNYLLWNTLKIRSKMNLRNHLLSFIGRYPSLTWLLMYLPNLVGKKIIV